MQRLPSFSCVFALAWALQAPGAVFHVPGNYATIAAAVQAVPDGSSIIVADGVYGLVNAENLGKNLYIVSANGPANCVISGGNATRLLRVENGATGGNPAKQLVFDGITFANGRGIASSASPVTIANASPVFLRCVFRNNQAHDTGGAVLVYSYGVATNPHFVDCVFQDNLSGLFGGAVLVSGGYPNVTFKRCTFQRNTTRSGASISNWGQGGAIKFAQAHGRVEDCIFRDNSTTYAGGALTVLTHYGNPQEGRVIVKGCIFENNSALPWPGASPATPPPSEGGGIMAEAFVHVEVSGSRFAGNTADSGAGIMVYRARLSVDNSHFEGNHALSQNPAGGGAGGLGINSYSGDPPEFTNAEVWLSNVVFRNNTAISAGAISAQGNPARGLEAQYRGKLHMNQVVLEGNRAVNTPTTSGNGGALFLNLMDVEGDGVWLLNNRADNYGGVGALVQNTRFQLANSYLVGNSAGVADHAIHAPEGPAPTLINTVVAYNGGSGTAALNRLVAIPSGSYGNAAYLTYLNLPFGSPAIQGEGVSLPNRGGYAAGAVLVNSVDQDRTYQLTTTSGNREAAVAHRFRSLPDRAFGGANPQLPRRLEAEHFDNGGQGIAYYDRTAVNEGGALRPQEFVAIFASASASGGHAVGWIEPGEWIEYTVRTPAQRLRLVASVAAAQAGGQFDIRINGVSVSGPIPVPATGGFHTFQEIELPQVDFAAGIPTVQFVCIAGVFNLDYLEFRPLLPTLALSTTLLSRSYRVGGGLPSPRTFDVRNLGSGTLHFSLTRNVNWLALSPTTGSSSGERIPISATFDPSGLAIGQYHGQITVTSSEAVNSPLTVAAIFNVLGSRRVRNDFDGDGRSDIGCYFAPGGNWYTFSTMEGFRAVTFGFAGTLPITGDFDGDALTDLGCYHPPSGMWYVFKSTEGFSQAQFGFAGTLPIVGDFDGDGRDDFGCYHPPSGMWYVFKSTEGFSQAQFGFASTLPVVGDFDGDGRDDFGCYHPPSGMWFIFRSTEGFFQAQFGFAGTLPVVGDFDGDGRHDFGCYHPESGSWFLYQSLAGFTQAQFGFAGTLPIVGDFDGDGRDDFGCYYPPTGNWYIFSSTAGFSQAQFGYAGTVPL